MFPVKSEAKYFSMLRVTKENSSETISPLTFLGLRYMYFHPFNDCIWGPLTGIQHDEAVEYFDERLKLSFPIIFYTHFCFIIQIDIRKHFFIRFKY